MLRLVALVAFGSLPLFLTPVPARGAGGDLLWQDNFDLAVGEDVARAVAASGQLVVAVGSAQNAAGNSDFLVRTYDANTGTLLWTDLVDVAGGEDAARAVALDDSRVFVAGVGVDGSGTGLLILRAYIANTGTLAWENRVPRLIVNGLAVDDSHVVVAGTTVDSAGNSRLTVQAYDAQNGALEWQDQPAPPPGFEQFSGAGRGVAIEGQRVFVAGTIRTAPGPGFNPTCLVRAYVTHNGNLDWEALTPGFPCSATAVATDGRNVVLAALGSSALDDFLAVSFDAETGQFLWQDRTFVGTGFDNEAVAVDIERHTAFV